MFQDLDHVIQEQLVLDHKSRPKSQKSCRLHIVITGIEHFSGRIILKPMLGLNRE